MKDDQDIMIAIRDAIGDQSGLKILMVYGSVAAGTMQPDSDVDVAVLFDSPLDANRRMELVDQLEMLLDRSVDLVDLFSIQGVIFRQILCKGKILVKKSASDFTKLMERMVYNQADMMPYYHRTIRERVEGFAHG